MSLRRAVALSGIHGSLPALEAVRVEVEQVRFVLGNRDREMAAAGRPEPARARRPARFEPNAEVAVEGLGRVLVCHGTPAGENAILTEASPGTVFATALDGAPTEVVAAVTPTWTTPSRSPGGSSSTRAASARPAARRAPSIATRRTLRDADLAAGRLPGTQWEDRADALAAPASRREASAVFERMAGRDIVTA